MPIPQLTNGLKMVMERLERVAFKGSTSPEEVVACGYVCGFIQSTLPRIENIPDDAPEVAAITASLRTLLEAFGKDPDLVEQ